MKTTFLLLTVISLTMLSCDQKQDSTSDSKAENVQDAGENDHWTYHGETGPQHWAEIEKLSQCAGKRQSPINIIDVNVEEDPFLRPLDIHYSSDVRIHEVSNNGHTILYNFEKGDYIMWQDEKYHLIQIHFHEASEHEINGIRYPLEMHMVHVSKSKKMAILAILAVEGESSKPFDFLEKYLPVAHGETKPIDANFDLNLNLPEQRDYYTYEGSLTTPPCTEGSQWFVFRTPITISEGQVKQLQALMPLNNYRDEQPINDRVIRRYVER